MPAVNTSMPVSRHTRFNAVQVSTAETSLTAPTLSSLGLLVNAVGVQNGVRVLLIEATATATTATNKLRFWLRRPDDAWIMLPEKTMAAATISATVAASNGTYKPPELMVIPEGWKLYVSTLNAETWNVIIYASDMEKDSSD